MFILYIHVPIYCIWSRATYLARQFEIKDNIYNLGVIDEILLSNPFIQK